MLKVSSNNVFSTHGNRNLDVVESYLDPEPCVQLPGCRQENNWLKSRINYCHVSFPLHMSNCILYMDIIQGVAKLANILKLQQFEETSPT